MTKTIPNQFDGSFPVPDKYDSKYFKYLGDIKDGGGSVIDALRTKDIVRIEQTIINIADSINSYMLLIGMACVIIDRERLYNEAGYRNYFEYAKHLYEETRLSEASISAAKIIVERYIDYNVELKKHGFKLERNSNKLLHLENALAAHKNKNDVFRHVCNDSYREFKDYSRKIEGRPVLPPLVPKMTIKEGKILVDGKDFDTLPDGIKKTVEQDFTSVYTIRAAGNAPVIVEAYDNREARTLRNRIDKLLKELRVNR
jgi:hypothetical protein